MMIHDDLEYDDPVECKSFNRMELNSLKNVINKQIWLLNYNIRSFHRNSDEFLGIIDKLEFKPDIYCLTETWFNQNSCEDIKNYKSFHMYRNQKTGGGISLFLKSRFSGVMIDEFSYVSDVMEVCTIKANIFGNSVIIMGIYRPPSGSIGQFDFEIGNILANFTDERVFVTGDLNIDLLNPDNQELNCINNFISSSFRSFINIPTRSTDRAASCIDHIWSNAGNISLAGVIEAHITDHIPCFVVFSVPSHEGRRVLKSFRDMSERNMSVFDSKLKDFIDNFVVCDSDDINLKVSYFVNHLYNIYNNSFPIRQKCFSHNRALKPWITDKHVVAIDHKFRLFRLYKSGHIPLVYYNYFKNRVTCMLRRAKCEYFTSKFNRCNGNPRNTWKLLNTITSRGMSNKQSPDEVLVGGDKIDNPREIADAFCEYFSKVGENLEANIPTVSTSPLYCMGESNGNSFFAAPTSPREVEAVIRKLNCHSGHSNAIPHKIFVKFAECLSGPIADLFNRSVSVGVFPEILKIGRVVPVYKAGSRATLSNYRPISTLSAMSKVFEKLMYSRLISYLETNNILACTQFGFRRGKSTEDAVLEFMDGAYSALENSEILIAVFLDLSKAFDTVNHDILLRKLYHLGLRGTMFDWFKSYLSNRTNYVSVNNASSQTRLIKYGVPQGSNLGPLLFLIYINDMKKSSPLLYYIQFADDTTAYIKGNDIDAIYTALRSELDKVSHWLQANRLSLNVNKTSYMIITNKKFNERELKISGSIVGRTNCIKFLGVTIDERLSFSNHVRDMVKKSVHVHRNAQKSVDPHTNKDQG